MRVVGFVYRNQPCYCQTGLLCMSD